MAGQDTTAMTFFEFVHAVDKDCHLALEGMGQVYSHLGDLKTAKQCLVNSLNLSPQHYFAMTKLGFVCGEDQSPLEAEAYFRAAMAINPRFVDAPFGLGWLAERNNHPSLAARYFEQALDLDEKHEQAMIGLFRACQQLVTSDALSEERLYRVSELFKTNFVYHPELVKLICAKNPVEPEQYFRKILDLNPNSVEAHLALASFYNHQQRDLLAIASFERVLALSKDCGPALQDLAYIYKRRGEKIRAQEYFRECLVVEPKNVGVKIELGILLIEAGNFEEGADILVKSEVRDQYVKESLRSLFYRQALRLGDSDQFKNFQAQFITLQRNLYGAAETLDSYQVWSDEAYLSDRFCSRPFEYFDTGRGPYYEAHLCCPAWVSAPAGSLKSETPDEVWNSKTAQAVRASIHDQTFSYCDKKRCPDIQGRTLPSREEDFDPYMKSIIKNKAVKLPRGPRELNLSSDRSCNLSCPSCRTQTFMTVKGNEFDKTKAVTKTLLDRFLPNLEWLLVTGAGDPFASRIYREFLTQLDGSQYPQLKIQLTTNGLLFDKLMWSRLLKIHKNIRRIVISFDAATAETYKVVRRGGMFTRLLENVRFLNEHARCEADFFLRLDYVVQFRNWREMPAFVRLGLELGVDSILFQKIVDWGSYSREEFQQHTICDEAHPEHSEFLRMLTDPVFDHPKVNLGNVSEFRAKALTDNAKLPASFGS